MSGAEYSGPALDGTEQYISERPELDRDELDEKAEDVVYATQPTEDGEETTVLVSAPDASEKQQAILEQAAVMDDDATRAEIHDALTENGNDVSYGYVCATLNDYAEDETEADDDDEQAEQKPYDVDAVTDLQADILDVAVEMGEDATQAEVSEECQRRGIDTSYPTVSKTMRNHLRSPSRQIRKDDEERAFDDLTEKQQVGVEFWEQYDPEESEYDTDTAAAKAFAAEHNVGYSTVWEAQDRFSHLIGRWGMAETDETTEVEVQPHPAEELEQEREQAAEKYQQDETEETAGADELEVSVRMLRRLVDRGVVDAEDALEEVELLVGEMQ